MKQSTYIKWSIATLILIFALIAVGSIVRATGAGLGCPDWPKCFGMWVPPTDVSQLPTNYQEVFKVAGKTIAPFDAFKTWTEYLNRLFGVIVGIFIFIVALTSSAFRKTKKNVFYGSIALFLLVGFQGWVGSVVVSTSLASYMITIHMLLAVIVTCLLIYLICEAMNLSAAKLNDLNKHFQFLLGMAIVQLILGTMSRAKIDTFLKAGLDNRHEWFESMGKIFAYHRSFAVLLVFLVAFTIFKFKRRLIQNDLVKKLSLAMLGLLGANYASGVLFKWLDFPAWNQPIHLVLAVMIISVLFTLSYLTRAKS